MTASSPTLTLFLGIKQVKTVPRRLLHRDKAIVLWLDKGSLR